MSEFIPDVAWLDGYEIGLAPLDDEHRNMIKLANQTARALKASKLG